MLFAVDGDSRLSIWSIGRC